MYRHKVDDLRSDVLRGHREVTLVLAIVIVDDNHHSSAANFIYCIGNGNKIHVRWAPIARVHRFHTTVSLLFPAFSRRRHNYSLGWAPTQPASERAVFRGSSGRPITNRPQDTILPDIGRA